MMIAKNSAKGMFALHDHCTAQIAEKDPLDREHQDAAEQEIMQNGVGGDAHQRTAVIIRNDPDPRWQRAVAVDPRDLLLHLRKNVVGVLRPSHHDDRGGDVVIPVLAGDSESWHVTDRDFRHILDLDWKAARLGEDHILDVLDMVALGDVVGAAGIDQPDAADVDGLLANRNLAAADIDVGVAERRDELRNGDVVGLELLQVGIDIELLGGAAPGVDLHDARNRH